MGKPFLKERMGKAGGNKKTGGNVNLKGESKTGGKRGKEELSQTVGGGKVSYSCVILKKNWNPGTGR